MQQHKDVISKKIFDTIFKFITAGMRIIAAVV